MPEWRSGHSEEPHYLRREQEGRWGKDSEREQQEGGAIKCNINKLINKLKNINLNFCNPIKFNLKWIMYEKCQKCIGTYLICF